MYVCETNIKYLKWVRFHYLPNSYIPVLPWWKAFLNVESEANLLQCATFLSIGKFSSLTQLPMHFKPLQRLNTLFLKIHNPSRPKTSRWGLSSTELIDNRYWKVLMGTAHYTSGILENTGSHLSLNTLHVQNHTASEYSGETFQPWHLKTVLLITEH